MLSKSTIISVTKPSMTRARSALRWIKPPQFQIRSER